MIPVVNITADTEYKYDSFLYSHLTLAFGCKSKKIFAFRQNLEDEGYIGAEVPVQEGLYNSSRKINTMNKVHFFQVVAETYRKILVEKKNIFQLVFLDLLLQPLWRL